MTTHQSSRNSIHWREVIKTLILLGMAVYLAMLMLTGNLSNYINIRFQWLTLVAVVLFGVLGLWSAYQLVTGRTARISLDNTGFMHGSFNWPSIVIVSIPLLFALAIPSQPLGASAVNGGVSMNPVGVAARNVINIPPEQRNILDWLREFNQEPEAAVFNGQPVDVIGFIYREPSYGEDQFMLTRYTMSCCVADAFAVGLPVMFDDASDWETGVWVRITGYLSAEDFDGERLPVIIPESIEPTEIPATPYLYS